MNALIAMIIQGFSVPATSARRILAAELKMEAVLLMVLFSYLVTAIIVGLLGEPVGGQQGTSVAFHVRGLLVQYVTFFIYSALIFRIGRMAGGTGTREQTQAVLAWHSMVTSFLAPTMLGLGSGMPTPEMTPEQQAAALQALSGPIMLAGAGAAVSLWLMAKYVKELHGFSSAWKVLGALLMGGVAFGIFFMIIASVLMGG